MRNPVKGVAREWFQGVNMVDAGAALAGFAAATSLPRVIVKTAEGAELSMNQKIMKIFVAAGATVVAGFACRNINANAGKMAIAGGLAGTLSQAIGSFTNYKIGGTRQIATRRVGRIAESRYENRVPEEAGVQVSVT